MQNTYTHQIEQGEDVYGSDGEKIGSVASVTGNYFVIEKGFLFTTDIYVPTSAIASVDDDGIRLAMTKSEVENQDWSQAPADDAYVSGADRVDETYASGDVTPEMSEGDRIQRSEERLTVDKQTEQAGSVRVGKHVVEEHQAVDVPVTREEVTIDRRAVDRPAEGGEVFTDQDIEVPVYEERVETDKEARVVEELEVGKTATTDTARVEDTVRREEFDVEGDALDDTTGSTRRDR